jgi:hypothetical protein
LSIPLKNNRRVNALPFGQFFEGVFQMTFAERLNQALKVGCIHLTVSIVVAALAAVLVFGLWYPYPYRELMGGIELFLLVVGVDVVCGPLLTMVLYNSAKLRSDLIRDLALVAVIQVVALVYGLHTVMVVRPVFLVFEVDRFSAISAMDVDKDALDKVSAPWNVLPMWGPKVIAARAPKDRDEILKSIDLSFKGLEPSMRPDWWQSFEFSRADVLKQAKPLSALRNKHHSKPDAIVKIDSALKESGRAEIDLRWLPLTSRRNTEWVVIIDAQTGLPVAYASVEGF